MKTFFEDAEKSVEKSAGLGTATTALIEAGVPIGQVISSAATIVSVRALEHEYELYQLQDQVKVLFSEISVIFETGIF